MTALEDIAPTASAGTPPDLRREEATAHADAGSSMSDVLTAAADRLDRLVEALLFEATAPLPSAGLAVFAARGLARDTGADEIDAAVERLRATLAGRRSALDVFAWAGGWRLATRADLAPLLDAARTPEPRPRALSAALLETLAIVAYKQPATRAEVEHVRGADCDYALARLVGLGLVDPVGRGDGVGRPMLYGTTGRFLDTFGLASLADLPSMRDVESLLADPAFSAERARLLAPSTISDVPDPVGACLAA